MDKKLVLASASPRRYELLNRLGLDIIVDPSNCSEDINNNGDYGTLVSELAQKKALTVAKRHKNCIIIGADTIVVIDNQILGKPSCVEQAEKMLKNLSGRWHSVFTGISLIDSDTFEGCKDFEESRVKFKKLTTREISNYIETGEPMDKAGGYGIQGLGSLLVEKIQGCYYNIVGLPLFKLNQLFSNFNIEII
jgi:septum formation protein